MPAKPAMNQHFHIILFTTVALTLVAGGGSFYLSGQELNPSQEQLLESLNTTWKAGSFTVFGLLAYQALPPKKGDEA
jgi:hypothetical protein